MIPVGQVWDTVYDMVQAVNAAKQLRAREIISARCFDLAQQFPWAELCRIEHAVPYVADTGILLPSPLCGLLGVWDAEGNVYQSRTEEQVQTRLQVDNVYRYWHPRSVNESLVTDTATGIDLTKDSATITAIPSYVAGWIGEYLSIGKWPPVWKVASETTLDVEWRGETTAGAVIQVRPPSTQRMRLMDNVGDEIADDVEIEYAWWTLPYPLFQEWELVPFPQTRLLEVAATVTILDRDKRRNDANAYREELTFLYEEAKALEPQPHVPMLPQDIAGALPRFGATTGPYGSRIGSEFCDLW